MFEMSLRHPSGSKNLELEGEVQTGEKKIPESW